MLQLRKLLEGPIRPMVGVERFCECSVIYTMILDVFSFWACFIKCQTKIAFLWPPGGGGGGGAVLP